MKILPVLLFAMTVPASPVYAHENTKDMPDIQMEAGQANAPAKSANTLKLSVVQPQPLEAGKEAKVMLSLTRANDGTLVTFDDLKETHTQKLHVLIVDPTLTDYHHVHPAAAESGSGYVFTFSPQKPGYYRMWADVIPTATGKQEYAIADLTSKALASGTIDKTMSDRVNMDGLTFRLTFDEPLTTGTAAMGQVTVTKDGKPFTRLEPVMGAFAHIVAFNEDRQSVVHIHPMGKEPETAEERGGPTLQFHIEPNKPGFTKLFVQVRVGGKNVFAPFGVMVK